jgi:hypothetical protein
MQVLSLALALSILNKHQRRVNPRNVLRQNTEEKRQGKEVIDDSLFRKTLVTTSRLGQTTVCMDKGNTLGKRDTTLTHRLQQHQEGR